jgi:hypothetical protein
VPKPANGRYHPDGRSTNWIKITNLGYTQLTAQHELFERRPNVRKRMPLLRACHRVRPGGTRLIDGRDHYRCRSGDPRRLGCGDKSVASRYQSTAGRGWARVALVVSTSSAVLTKGRI